MNTQKRIALARKHYLDNETNKASAALCLSDAVALYDAGDYDAADRRAVKSLAYSVGIFHADYKAAAKFLQDAEDKQMEIERSRGVDC